MRRLALCGAEGMASIKMHGGGPSQQAGYSYWRRSSCHLSRKTIGTCEKNLSGALYLCSRLQDVRDAAEPGAHLLLFMHDRMHFYCISTPRVTAIWGSSYGTSPVYALGTELTPL